MTRVDLCTTRDRWGICCCARCDKCGQPEHAPVHVDGAAGGWHLFLARRDDRPGRNG